MRRFKITSSNTAAGIIAFDTASAVALPPLNLNGTNVTLMAWIDPDGSIGAQNPYTGIVYCRGAGTSAGLIFSSDGTKLASIGMRIRGGVTSHGFALNIAPDLEEFTRFTACGLPDVTMTSLAELAARQGRSAPSEAEVRDAVAKALGVA